jgi:serine/threonine protein kinase
VPDRGLQIGDTVAGRRIDAMIGRGGMGVVYRAWNETMGRDEAVKMIAEELANDRSFRERFLRETKIAASLEHPHVIPVYDAAEGPGNQLFMTMRYVEDGKTLASLIAERDRLDPATAARVISDIASALDAAHARGLVHRDVKPANILITGQAPYYAYLTDFGLSKRLSAETVLSRAGTVVGTDDYMSPEQAEGRLVDLRTDVYALGATLFEALAGSVPYPGDSYEAKMVAKVNQPPPMVSQAAHGIPPEFDAVIARALAKDPDERYPSAGELGRAAQAAARHPSQVSVQREIGVGSVLADCLIEEMAGKGGMAVVYRATHQKLGRKVALKVMSPELANDPLFRARFEREWKIAAAIEHPNVIDIHWAGEANGRLYIVMRLVEGGTLRETLESRGRLEPRLAVEVIEQLASALDAAHGRGLVHRDVKPGNVLIEEETGRVYLTDFGLAKGLEDAEITDGGQVLGTARYLPPERHRDSEIDEVLGDVYSLGCVLWDLLGGIDRAGLETVEGVPPSLAQVVTRAVELEPSARFASAGELARAAREALDPGTAGEPADQLPAPTTGATTVARSAERRQPFEPTPLSRGLSDRVLGVCETALELLADEGEARAALESVDADLRAPLRVAVIGAAGSGRSTLINAILGRRLSDADGFDDLAPQVSFTYGVPERVRAVLEDGSQLEHGLRPDGGLPAEVLEVADRLASLRVWLPLDALRAVSLIHLALPPGKGLAEIGARGDADAFLVAVPAQAAGDVEALRREISEIGAALRISAVNASLVLTKADLAAPEGSVPAEAAKSALGPMVAAVTPLRGLLAETANAGLVTNDDVALLGELARVEPREELVSSTQAFLDAPSPISAEQRKSLLGRYGLYGMSCAFELADAGQLTGIDLRRRLREVSGIEDVDREIDGFHQRADALQADRALDRLDELSYRWPELSFLRDQVETIRLESAMHLVDLIRAFERCARGEVDVPDELLEPLELLITARTPARRLGLSDEAGPAELHGAALAGFRAWKTFENAGQATPAAARVARAVARSYEFGARELQPAPDGAAPSTRGQ